MTVYVAQNGTLRFGIIYSYTEFVKHQEIESAMEEFWKANGTPDSLKIILKSGNPRTASPTDEEQT